METKKYPLNKYTLNYFIKKFAGIASSKWCVQKLKNDQGQCCALGHCGGYHTPEAMALKRLVQARRDVSIVDINDASRPGLKKYGNTPKKRVMSFLRMLVKESKK
jgi:hypothetical protein